jgi:hypothetical protein
MSILFILNLFIDCLYATDFIKKILIVYVKHWVLWEGVYKVELLENLQYRIIRQLYAFPFFLALN